MKRFFLVPLAVLLCALAACADTSFLKPPPGASVALVVFEDMQCPDCARAFPLVTDAAKRYNIPLLLHDFPLPQWQHPWAYDAAVLARFFDAQSKQLGDDFRAYIYQNQPLITVFSLRGWADRFASQHKVAVPFMFDPQGEFAAKVRADRSLGERIPLEHTPTIYIVSNKASGTVVTEVQMEDRPRLGQLIEQARREAAPVPSAAKTAATKADPKGKSSAAKAKADPKPQ